MLQSVGYAVIETSNGAAALELLEQYAGRVDLMLTDGNWPDDSRQCART